MYSYCCLCILIFRQDILIVVYVFLLLSMYSYFSSRYSDRCLCILIVVYVFLLLPMSFLDAATLTEVFPCFFLCCKANARVNLAKTGHGPHYSKIVVLFYVLFVLCCSFYCLCVNVHCTTATGRQPIAVNKIYHIIYSTFRSIQVSTPYKAVFYM